MAELEAQNIAQYKEKVIESVKGVENPAQQLKTGLDNLAGNGGFDLLEMAFAGVENMNPERKARKRIFLSESAYKGDRDKLKKTLQLWAAVLSSTESISSMVEAADQISPYIKKYGLLILLRYFISCILFRKILLRWK